MLLLTLNYDTLLEGAIRRVFHHEFRTMGDYRWSEEDGRQWALVKLHGSTTWGRRLRCKAGAERWADLVGGLTDLDMDPEFIPLEGHQGQHRLVGGHYCYPAIALPIGGKSNFVCPREHLELANGMLRGSSHLLVIGFSGLDQHVLRILRQAEGLLTAKIVDNGPSADQVLARFRTVGSIFGPSPKEILYPEGFRQFVRVRELHRFLGVGGPSVVPMDPRRLGGMTA